jgi:hypothetical protein
MSNSRISSALRQTQHRENSDRTMSEGKKWAKCSKHNPFETPATLCNLYVCSLYI